MKTIPSLVTTVMLGALAGCTTYYTQDIYSGPTTPATTE